jgi:hypothetical protein
MNKGDKQEYTWTVGDVRQLDSKLGSIENKIDANYHSFKEDVAEIKESLKNNHLVVDNTNKTDWKGIGIIVGATIAAILAAIQQVKV